LSGQLSSEVETEYHVHIVAALAAILGVQVPPNQIADGTWKDDAWREYGYALLDTAPRDIVSTYGLLIDQQRPLFGVAGASNWSYYGYLSRVEVHSLRTALERTADAFPHIASGDFIDGFHEVIVGWLCECESRGTDMWLYAT
jgi:hypothetical protein